MINLEWVKDYIDIENEDLNKLAVKITKAGINIEKVISNHIDNLVIGKILTCQNHPDSDHLHVLTVDVGNEVLQIVCGASNVREDIKVIVAKVGAILPGDFEIKKSKIRGIESNGMICALFELGLEEKNDETYNKGIHIVNDNAKVGVDALKYLGLENTIYELDIHKHRNNDCYYHIGFAYEIGAVLDKKVKFPDMNYQEIDNNINNYMNLAVKTSKCPYFLGKIASNITIKESPDFIKKRLNSVGIRSINNVVDISNYVMLEFGQPMHFYDLDTISKEIIVRDATDDEKLITLDGNERILNKNDIVIADNDKAICLAGVMGGENTEVTDNTKNIFIESAIFDPASIRVTSQRLNLRSEASIRYAKGLNYEYTNYAIDRACHLLEKYADAKIYSGILTHDIVNKEEKKVSFKSEDIGKMLGININNDDIEKQLERLDFSYKLDNNVFNVIIPKRRLDIDPYVNDIAEEIGRLYGYDNLASTMPVSSIKKGTYVGNVKYIKEISKRLRSLSLNEVKTYTLVSPKMKEMFNYEDKENIILNRPMSTDKSVIRTTLIPSLLNVYDYNKQRKVENVNIYEISKTYDINYNEEIKVAFLLSGKYIKNTWNVKSSNDADFYLIKGIMEDILNYMGLKNRYYIEKGTCSSLHPGISADIFLDREKLGVIGKVHPSIVKDNIYVCELSLNKMIKNIKPIKFSEASIYPDIKKDLAFIVSKDMNAETLKTQIKKSGGRLLQTVEVFDVYYDENVLNDKKSIAFSLTFNGLTKTLNDDEVMEVFNKIINEVTIKCNATLRDK